MKIAVYTKRKLKENTVKISLVKGLVDYGFSVIELDDLNNLDGFDRLLVFGGDGTMLYCATHANCPIVGINLGNVGFLTQHEANVSVEELICAIHSSCLEDRPLLETAVEGKRCLSLNEFVIKTTSSRPISFSVKINGDFVDTYHADGIIIATPTGSTAYSLSAGGPILSPDVNAIIINPICPHSLHSRPLIVSGESKIDIKIDGDDAVLITDGREQIDLKNMTDIQISKANQSATFVCGNNNFYNKLLEKMNKWGVTR